ncbi:MAG: toxin [Armatimonadetes bacterium]|nr:toxin [Armatimonadota bacterium]
MVLFVESANFTRDIGRYMNDEEYRRLQVRLLRQPQAGAVMPGCGGLRKIRAPDRRRGKGSRGGLRIIYLDIPEINWIFMLDIYDKDEQDDLSPDEKRQLAALAARLRLEAIRRNEGT